MAKIIKICLIFLIMTGWIYSGWPQIWPLGKLGVNTIQFPPKIQDALLPRQRFLETSYGNEYSTDVVLQAVEQKRKANP